ncbi:phosphotransferase [Actinoplanes sp. NPDC049802]|uniref:phosphotransferase n=1 Tax=Actinoplanes sp. NPDC049802 TaxID=3154742 RepID=UPI0033DB39AA
MSSTAFVKRYRDPACGLAAQAHLRWWDDLGAGIRLPHRFPGTATHLILERISGHTPELGDLPQVAAALGRLHGIAYARHLHQAHLDRPFDTGAGLTIADFYTGRHRVLADSGLDTAGLPAAVYKDANIRNFLITKSGPALLDFDDLTLAPFGYDLAKLVVSAVMTTGSSALSYTTALLAIYNDHVTAAGGPAAPCTLWQFASYADIHGLLTARYLHTNGYRHPWPAGRLHADTSTEPSP